MIKLLFLFLFMAQSIFACALCTIYSPTTRVIIDVKSDEKTINEIDIKWILTKPFTDTLKSIYDTNLDTKLDEKELSTVKNIFLDYVKPRNYLTHISYGKKINKNRTNTIKVKDLYVYIENDILHITYKINLNYKIAKDNILYLNIEDKEQFFLLELEQKDLHFDDKLFKEEIIDLNSVSFLISKDIVEEQKEEIKDIKKEIDLKNDETFLMKFSKQIKKNLLEIKNGNTIALFTLLFVSFLYGIIHAIGPGHGKTLAFSYFMSTKSSYLKAFVISQLSAFIHIVGALILVLISVFIIESVFNNFVNDSVVMITKLSALLIMILAMYILYNKLKKKNSATTCCGHDHHDETKKQDIFFVITSGIIPCPGTVILFLYAFLLKTYFAVILASIFISLGMGLVIFLSSFLSIKLNRVSSRVEKIKNIIEIISPIVIFILGLLLFFNTNLL